MFSDATSIAPVVHVCRAERVAPVRPDTFIVALRFADALARETVQADTSDRCLTLTVSSHWQVVRADFGQQLLNTRVAAQLMALRPRAMVVECLSGATLDLLRLGPILGLPTWLYDPTHVAPEDVDARRWYDAALADVAGVLTSEDDVHRAVAATGLAAASAPLRPFDYALYEFVQRDHALLDRMLAPVLPHFDGCQRVLDLACGPGIAVHALQRRGVAASGVERSPMAVRYARAIGLDIVEDDALAFLARQREAYDGLLCSHFVEHLPINVVEQLMTRVAEALTPGGVAVFVFPDPESIRSQLLGFWRDPEHVRFYHPDLIALLARTAGLECDFHSHHAQPHRVIGFAPTPPAPPLPATVPAVQGWRRWLPGARQLDAQSRHIAVLEAQVQGLRQAVDTLWQVNQTWAWDDNAILRVRKPGAR